MKRHRFLTVGPLLILALSACSYRFVDPFPARSYDLVSVANSTAEPGLSRLLEQELRQVGGFNDNASSRLYVTVTGFSEKVETVSSESTPLRQRLTMEVAWKVEGEHRSEAVFGRESAREIYPYSPEPAALEWNRRAAVKLLARRTADLIILRLERAP